MRVTVGREDLKHAVLDLQDRNVERAAAEVVHRDGAAIALVEAVGERCGRWLVDDAQHLESRKAPGVARRGPLCVVEIRGDRDDGAVNLEVDVVAKYVERLAQGPAQ